MIPSSVHLGLCLLHENTSEENIMKIHGLDELQQNLKNLSNNAKAISGENEVPYTDLFHQAFMKKRTKYSDISDFLSGAGVESQEDLELIPDEKLDAFVQANSEFPSWEEMLGSAGEEWAADKLFKGIK